MQITEIKEIAPLLTGLITATAAIVAVIVTSIFNLKVAKLNIDHQNKQKNKELKITKLEELVYLFEKWQLTFSHIYLFHLRCYRKQLDFDHIHELVKELDLLAPGEAQKYKIIMLIHFPSLEEEYAPVETARKLIVPFLSDPRKNGLSTLEFEKLQSSFEKYCEIFKSKITQLAHTISIT